MLNDSRYRHSFETIDDDGYAVLSEHEPFAYEDLPDNSEYEAKDGDTWHSIALKKLSPLPRASNLFWVIMDFQPDPPLDPSIPPEPGQVLVIPSRRTVKSKIQDPDRRSLA